MDYNELTEEEVVTAAKAAKRYALEKGIDFDPSIITNSMDKMIELKEAEKAELMRPRQKKPINVTFNNQELDELLYSYDVEADEIVGVIRKYISKSFDRIGGNLTDPVLSQRAYKALDEDNKFLYEVDSGKYVPREYDKLELAPNIGIAYEDLLLLIKLNNLRREQYYLYYKFCNEDLLNSRCHSLLEDYRRIVSELFSVINRAKDWDEKTKGFRYHNKVVHEQMEKIKTFYGGMFPSNEILHGIYRNANGYILPTSFESAYAYASEIVKKAKNALDSNGYSEEKIVIPDYAAIELLTDDCIRAGNTIKFFDAEEYRNHCIDQMHLTEEEILLFEMSADEYLRKKINLINLNI